MNTMYWLVKREFWEHRGSFLWAPIVSGAIVLALTIMGIVTSEVFRSNAGIHLNGIDLGAIDQGLDAATRNTIGAALDVYMLSPGLLIALVLFVVVLFYCVNALAEDRRDRSILFWRSLPISETQTVVSKVIAAGFLAPLIAVITSLVFGLLMLVTVAVFAAAHGLNAWQILWALPHPLRITARLLSTLPLYLVWALPAIGWLLACSAWTRRKGFLWAVGLPLGAGVLVAWFNAMGSVGIDTVWFWRHIVARALLGVFPGSWIPGQIETSLAGKPHDESWVLDHLLSVDLSPLWSAPFLIGAVIGIGLIAVAIWLRRWRADI